MKKRIIISSVAIILGILWILRYNSLNSFYQNNYGIVHETYQMGETVEFGQDYIYGEQVEGYTFTAEKAELLTYSKFMSKYGINTSDVEKNDLIVCDITVKVSNLGSTAPGVYIPYLTLYGADFQVGWSDELLNIANPFLQGNLGFSLYDGETCTIQLAYGLSRNSFTDRTWRSLDQTQFWMRLTDYPTEKRIAIAFS